MKKAALISVSDRSGLVEFAKGLAQQGYELLATTGSADYLGKSGVKTVLIEEYTGQKEILDGRVKTLHPKIHAGLLARRDNVEHMRQLEQDGIMLIDVVVVNLYPFIEHMAGEHVGNPDKMIEYIDIGGPTMLRAASKNFKFVWPVIDPADYPALLQKLADQDSPAAFEFRRGLANKVFTTMANYDLQIAKYLSNVEYLSESGAVKSAIDTSADFCLGGVTGQVLLQRQPLRYGENPHQRGAYYEPVMGGRRSWEQLNGKDLSYNNFLDFDAALRVVRALPADAPAAVIVKHLNPCGAAMDPSLLLALQKAKRGDPRSHFGGIIALNTAVELSVAEEIAKDFVEIVVAPAYSEEALSLLKKKSNLRVIKTDLQARQRFELRSAAGGTLVQEADPGVSAVCEMDVVSVRKPSTAELADLQFAWTLCAHVKSNAIVFAKDSMLLAGGAGQTSRIDAVEVAIYKARTHEHSLQGAAAASDAFFPFTDCLELMANNGVTAVVAPAGAKRDDEVAAAADKLGMTLLFAKDRHFRH